MKTEKRASAKSEKDLQVMFQKMDVGTGSLRPAMDIGRVSETTSTPNIPLSAIATTDANTIELVLTADGTTIEKSGSQFEGPRDDLG